MDEIIKVIDLQIKELETEIDTIKGSSKVTISLQGFISGLAWVKDRFNDTCPQCRGLKELEVLGPGYGDQWQDEIKRIFKCAECSGSGRKS